MSVLSYLTLFLGLAAIGTSAPVKETKPVIDTEWDVIVVGGGPAGLSALSGLARVDRKTLLIDSGVYRNGVTRQVHDVLGYDGVTPAYLRQVAREQILHYETITLTNGTVKNVIEERSPDKNGTLFTVEADLLPPTRNKERKEGGAKAKPYKLKARKVVLATGLKDNIPSTPGFTEYWGKGLFWCPWCDGHEQKGQKLGIIANLNSVPALVREMSTLNKDIKVFVNGTDTKEFREKTTKAEVDGGLPADWEKFLEKRSVTIDNRTISAVVLLKGGDIDPDADPSLPSNPHNDLFRLEFTEGDAVDRNGFLTNYAAEQYSDVGEKAGVTITENGKLTADLQKGMQTNIKGIYAVGDANSDDSTNVPHAFWSGKRSAVSAHVALAKEDEIKELDGGKKKSGEEKRDIEFDERAVWRRVNGEVGKEALHGGEFDG